MPQRVPPPHSSTCFLLDIQRQYSISQLMIKALTVWMPFGVNYLVWINTIYNFFILIIKKSDPFLFSKSEEGLKEQKVIEYLKANVATSQGRTEDKLHTWWLCQRCNLCPKVFLSCIIVESLGYLWKSGEGHLFIFNHFSSYGRPSFLVTY